MALEDAADADGPVKVGKNRWHVDLVTDGPVSEEVDRLVTLGARHLRTRQDPTTLDVLEDPEGNLFCVSNSATLTGWT